jgi:hypothetical protein
MMRRTGEFGSKREDMFKGGKNEEVELKIQVR